MGSNKNFSFFIVNMIYVAVNSLLIVPEISMNTETSMKVSLQSTDKNVCNHWQVLLSPHFSLSMKSHLFTRLGGKILFRALDVR